MTPDCVYVCGWVSSRVFVDVFWLSVFLVSAGGVPVLGALSVATTCCVARDVYVSV